LVNDCEVLSVDSLMEELELTPLKVEYLKGHRALKRKKSLEIGGIENVWEPPFLRNPP
jgi:hypothetical protein